MTDIMRLEPRSEEDGYYALAFLLTDTGQTLLKRDPAGSVINHLSAMDLSRIPVPLLDKPDRSFVTDHIRQAVLLEGRAAETVAGVDERLRAALDLPPARDSIWPLTAGRPRFTTATARNLKGRMDAEFFSMRHAEARSRVQAVPHQLLVAASEPRVLGRYRRLYLEPPKGVPILAGGQAHQLRPVELQRISRKSFHDPEAYQIREGWSLIGCDGRAEAELGRAAWVMSAWDGWMASNHLMRVVPREIDDGYLFATLRLQEVQIQLKSCATGSVVDALDESSIAAALIPRIGVDDERLLGEEIRAAHGDWVQAMKLEREAIGFLEARIAEGYEQGQPPRT